MTNTVKEKLICEQHNLDKLLGNVGNYLVDEDVLSTHSRDLLELQAFAMVTYSEILGKRIDLLEDA